ncbi:MAG: hypothetical protein JW704_11495 [Anaerolineaceae bacterium]|nr:hypothetical protein [Anaerolineaceae bacterium]
MKHDATGRLTLNLFLFCLQSRCIARQPEDAAVMFLTALLGKHIGDRAASNC